MAGLLFCFQDWVTNFHDPPRQSKDTALFHLTLNTVLTRYYSRQQESTAGWRTVSNALREYRRSEAASYHQLSKLPSQSTNYYSSSVSILPRNCCSEPCTLRLGLGLKGNDSTETFTALLLRLKGRQKCRTCQGSDSTIPETKRQYCILKGNTVPKIATAVLYLQRVP